MRVESTETIRKHPSLLRDERGAMGVNWLVLAVGAIAVVVGVVQGVGSALEPGMSNVSEVIGLGTSGEVVSLGAGETWPEGVPRPTPPRPLRRDISANIGEIPGNSFFTDPATGELNYMSPDGLVSPASEGEDGRPSAEHVVFDEDGVPRVVVPNGYDPETATIHRPGAQVDTVADELNPMESLANDFFGNLKKGGLFGPGAAEVDPNLSASEDAGSDALAKLGTLYGDDATRDLDQALSELAASPDDPGANERVLTELWRMRQRTLGASLGGAGLSTDPVEGDPPSYAGQTVTLEAARAHVAELAQAAQMGAGFNKIIEGIQGGGGGLGNIFKDVFN